MDGNRVSVVHRFVLHTTGSQHLLMKRKSLMKVTIRVFMAFVSTTTVLTV
jgi:hypothetical protein